MNSSSNIFFPKDLFIRSLVKCIWRSHERDVIKRYETILPKGNAEIIFNLCGNISYFGSTADNKQAFPKCIINGVNDSPFNLVKEGEQVFLGIQLNVYALKYLFNIPVKEFNNNVIDGKLVCKKLDDLWYQISNEFSFEKQTMLVLKWVYEKLAASKHFIDLNPILHLHSKLHLNEFTVKSLRSKYNYSERHVRRLFNNWFGMNVESFIQYKKYLKALHLIHQSTLNLTQIACDSGYYDQSHFIREFKSLTNMTPKHYQQRMSGLLGHIYYSI